MSRLEPSDTRPQAVEAALSADSKSSSSLPLVAAAQFRSDAVADGVSSRHDVSVDQFVGTSTSSLPSLTGCGAHSCRDFSIARLLDHPFPPASRICVSPLDLRSSTGSGSSGRDKLEERDVAASWLRSADRQVWCEGRLADDDRVDRQSSSRHHCRHHARLLMLHKRTDDEGPTILCSSTVDDRRQMTTYSDHQQNHANEHHVQGQLL